MSGIGGITYGQSQYASSGPGFLRNRLFKEYLYFKGKRTSSLFSFYKEFLKFSETFYTHLVEIWIRLKEYILVSHNRLNIFIKKFIVDTLSLQDPLKTRIETLHKDFLQALERMTKWMGGRESFSEVLRVRDLYVSWLSVVLEDFVGVIDSGFERISGVFSIDTIKVTHKKVRVGIKKFIKNSLHLIETAKRKLNGLPVGWSKKIRPETDWTKKDRVETDWTKIGRKDI